MYANNLNCTWTVGRPGCMTEIDFYEIDIEDLHLLRKCPYDRLVIQTCKRIFMVPGVLVKKNVDKLFLQEKCLQEISEVILIKM